MARGMAVGAIRIDIMAKTAKFFQAIRESRSRLEKFKRATQSMTRLMARAWKSVSLALAGVTAGFVAGLKTMASYSAKIVETSRNVGTTTKTLENFRAVLAGDGLNARKADKALEAFNRRIGQAKQGVGEARRALEALGIDLRDVNGAWKSNDSLLREVTESLHALGDEQLAAAHAADLFSDVGKRMAATLVRMGADYETAMRSAGRFHTLTQEQHEANKDLDQAFTDLKANLLDFKNRLLAQFAPQIESVVQDVNEWISSMKDTEGLRTFTNRLKEIAELAVRISGAIGGLMVGASLGSLGGPIGAIVGASMGAMAGAFTPEIAGLITKLAKEHFDVGSFDDKIAKLEGERQSLQGQLDAPWYSYKSFNVKHPRDRANAERRVEAINAEIAALEREKAAFQSAQKYMGSGSGTGGSARVRARGAGGEVQTSVAKRLAAIPGGTLILNELDGIRTQMEELSALGGNFIDPPSKFGPIVIGIDNPYGFKPRWDREETDYNARRHGVGGPLLPSRMGGGSDWNRRVTSSPIQSASAFDRIMALTSGNAYGGRRPEDVRSALADSPFAGNRLPEFKSELESVNDELRNTESIMQKVKSSFEDWAMSALDGFDSVGEGLKGLAKSLLREAWRTQVVSPLSGALFGESGGGGLLGGLFGGLIPARADGGMAHGLTLVGERGPEIVDFRKPGMVYPNGTAPGGGGVNITINVSSTDGPGVRAALANATPALVSAAKSAVAEDATRRGAFRAMVRGRR